jgi:hypothetical protein
VIPALVLSGCLILPSTPRTVITIHNVHDRKRDVAITKAVCDAVAARHQMELVDVNWGSDQILTYNKVDKGLLGKSHGPPSIVLNYDRPDTIGVIVGGGMDYDGGRREVADDILPELQRHFGKRVSWFNDKWTEF